MNTTSQFGEAKINSGAALAKLIGIHRITTNYYTNKKNITLVILHLWFTHNYTEIVWVKLGFIG